MYEFMLNKYHHSAKSEGKGLLEQNTDILGGYCRLETLQATQDQERLIGKFVREHQLISASACTSFKSSMYVREALSGKNAKLLDKSKMLKDHDEMRTSELTPLMVACMMSNMQTVRILIEHARQLYLPHSPEDFRTFVDIKIDQGKGGNNALLYACSNSQPSKGEEADDDSNQANYILVRYLIDEAGADPNISNDTLQNALLISTKRNQLNVVDLLFQKNVDITACDKNGCNALHLSSSNGFLEMTEMILNYRAKVIRERGKDASFEIDAEDSLTLTALMKASINGHLEIVKLLLKFGANPRKKNKRGESALAMACMQENIKICERLIFAKADVNEIDVQKRTPLLKAARHNSKSDILQLLLKAGARTDTADEEGNTPLHFAAIRGSLEVGTFLLKLGADPYVRNKKGMVPYELSNREEIVTVFSVCFVCQKGPAQILCNHNLK